MQSEARMLRKFVVVFAILVVVVAFFLMRDYDSPELGQALLDEVGAATGIEMTATGFRFNLFSGVELDNVTATSQSEGRSFSFSLDQLVFEHRILPLLSGTVAIDRIVLDRPQFELVEASARLAPKPKLKLKPKLRVDRRKTRAMPGLLWRFLRFSFATAPSSSSRRMARRRPVWRGWILRWRI